MEGDNSGIGSSTNRKAQSSGKPENNLVCDCGKEAIIRQAWTDANPGRRFYTCGEDGRGVCKYFRWRDVEKPHGWQKMALIEARDLIKAQEEEIKLLREKLEGGGVESNERLNDMSLRVANNGSTKNEETL